MEKVHVDKDLCIACGSCVAMCPEHFEFDDDNLAKAVNDSVDDDVRDAASACPTEAIVIEEEAVNDSVDDEVRDVASACPTEATVIEEEDE